MLTLSPPLFSTNIGYCPVEDTIGHQDQNYFFGDNNIEPANSSAQSQFLHIPLGPLQPSDDQQRRADQIDCVATSTSATTAAFSSDRLSMAVKKLNHNASERDRRNKINQMYSSLRSLLPSSDHTRKLSIPAIVSRALNYIPEIQKEVEGLIQKREELLSKINSGQLHGSTLQVKNEINSNNQKKTTSREISLSTFSSSQLNDKEFALQISSYKIDKNPLSEILHSLEEAGVLVLNASSFASFGGRIFHNLHLKEEGSYNVECGSNLGGKLMSFCKNKQEMFI